jgi:hypothetical protein
MSKILELHRKAETADEAFGAELRRLFGKEACDARYDKRGVSTPELKALAEAKITADTELHNAFMAA